MNQRWFSITCLAGRSPKMLMTSFMIQRLYLAAGQLAVCSGWAQITDRRCNLLAGPTVDKIRFEPRMVSRCVGQRSCCARIGQRMSRRKMLDGTTARKTKGHQLMKRKGREAENKRSTERSSKRLPRNDCAPTQRCFILNFVFP